MRLLFLKLFKDLIGWVLDFINGDEGFQMGSISRDNSMPVHWGRIPKQHLKSNRESAMTKAVLAVDIEFVDKMSFTWRNTYMELVTYHLPTSDNRTFSMVNQAANSSIL